MSDDGLSDIIDTLSELKRMHQLSLELLEQLDVTCGWLLENKIHPPNEKQFYHLVNKTKVLFEELRADNPKVLCYQAIRRKVTEQKFDESDGEVTEPENESSNLKASSSKTLDSWRLRKDSVLHHPILNILSLEHLYKG